MTRPPSHEPGYQNRNRSDEYEASIRCTNCGWRGKGAIKRGVTVADAIKDEPCQRCGCKTLVQVKP